MVTILAKLKARPGKEKILADECVQLAKEVRNNESGCLLYIPHVSVENPEEIVFFEKYQDQSAFDFHAATSYFKAFAAKLGELLDESLIIQVLNELT